MTEIDLAAENACLRARVEDLIDRVITAETGRTDAADLQRELDELRRTWADIPTTEDAIAKLREWVPDYEVGAAMVAMPVAMARKLLAAVGGPYAWGESVTWARGRILVPLCRGEETVADLELDEAGAEVLAAMLADAASADEPMQTTEA